MSFRALLIATFVVNLVVLGVMSILLYQENRKNVADWNQLVQNTRGDLLRNFVDAYSSTEIRAKVDAKTSLEDIRDYERQRFRRLLSYKGLDELCQDVLIGDNLLGTAGGEFTYIWVNPIGAYHRNHEEFSLREVKKALRETVRTGKPREFRDGTCLPSQARGEVLGGGWFSLRKMPGRTVSTRNFLITICLALLVFACILVYLTRAVTDATRLVRSRERELILSGRLAALGTLAAGIAHEINNPLGGMVNAVSRLRKSANANKDVVDKQEIWLELLDEGLAKVGRIVHRTLEFAPRTVQPVRFKPYVAIEKAQALIQHRLDSNAVCFETLVNSKEEIRGDPHELTQVFLNVFLNSLDAMAEAQTAAPKISVTIEARKTMGQFLQIRVSDNGPGADQDCLERIFDPFYSNKGATSKAGELSSGLGMSISYAIIEQHGGRISVSSPDTGGFLVQLELPIASGEESSFDGRAHEL